MKRVRLLLIALVLLGLAYYGAQEAFGEVPILMYHIVDYPDPRLDSPTVTPETFEYQMEFLKIHRYHVRPLAEIVADLKSRKKIRAKTVAITFDDGTSDNFKNALPVLKKMEFPATIFMITNNINKHGWLTADDLKQLEEAGITIGSHTQSHAFLPEHSLETVKEELTGSKTKLEEILGHPVTLFSYPAGGMTPEIRALVQDAGYEGAVTTNYAAERHDFYALHRVKIKETNSFFSFWAKLSGFYHIGKKRVTYQPSEEKSRNPY